jgi:hypothetical protein
MVVSSMAHSSTLKIEVTFLQHMGGKTKSYIKLRDYLSFTWRVGGEYVCVIDDEEKQ